MGKVQRLRELYRNYRLWNARRVCRFRRLGFDSRVRDCSPLGRLLWVIERMYRLNLSIHDVNPVKNVIHSINSFHVEDGCNVISLDDVLF
jgi:hypothetical protein